MGTQGTHVQTTHLLYVEFPLLLIYARRVFGSEYTRTLSEGAIEEQESFCQHKCVRRQDLQLELSRAEGEHPLAVSMLSGCQQAVKVKKYFLPKHIFSSQQTK